MFLELFPACLAASAIGLEGTRSVSNGQKISFSTVLSGAGGGGGEEGHYRIRKDSSLKSPYPPSVTGADFRGGLGRSKLM